MSEYPDQQITLLRKQGKLAEAYALGQELVNQDPENFRTASALGWVLYEKAKQFALRSGGKSTAMDRNDEEIRRILAEYSQLNVRRPDLLFSLLMVQVQRLDPIPSFVPSFLQWAGLDCFRPEDFQAEKGRENDTVWAPLVEKLAAKVAKAVCDSEDSGEAIQRFAVELIDLAFEKAQVQTPIWLHYRKAILLGLLGETEEARKQILPVIRQKSHEFWVWSAFGKIMQDEDPKLALALYAKAYVQCSDKGFAVRVLAAIAQIGRAVGRSDLAKWAVDKGISIRQERDWSVPESLMEQSTSDWYADATIPEDPENAVGICAEAAEELHPSRSKRMATFLGTFQSKDDKILVKLGIRRGRRAVETVFPLSKQPDLAAMQLGAPLEASVDMDGEQIRFSSAQPREGGSLFDCLTPVYGVIDHHNSDKALASVYVSASEFLLLHYKDNVEVKDWPLGSTVEVLCAKHQQGRLNPYMVKRTPARQTADIRLIQGPLKVHPKGYGFVGDAFVPPTLVEAKADGDNVEVVAVKKPKKSHDPDSVLGWQAISMSKVSAKGGETPDVESEPESPPSDDLIGFGEVEDLPEELDISYDELPF